MPNQRTNINHANANNAGGENSGQPDTGDRPPIELVNLFAVPSAAALVIALVGEALGHGPGADDRCLCGAQWHDGIRSHRTRAGLEALAVRGRLPSGTADIAGRLLDDWTGSFNELADAIGGITC